MLTGPLRWAAAAVVALVLTSLALLGVGGQYPFEGPVVVSFTLTHGVHAGDLLVAAAWLVAMVLLVVLARSGRRSKHR